MSGNPPQLNESYPAEPASVSAARRRIVQFAASVGADERRLEAVRLASSEALTNAVLHAYGDSPGQVHVTAAIADDDLWVLIADDGHGLRAHADRPGLGLGLALISQLSDELCVEARATGGTEVRMRFPLLSRHEGSPDPRVPVRRHHATVA